MLAEPAESLTDLALGLVTIAFALRTGPSHWRSASGGSASPPWRAPSMPSIQMAYAEITAAGIAQTARSPLLRRLAPAYPPAVGLIVLSTANHFLLDGVAGSLLGRTSLAAARLADDVCST